MNFRVGHCHADISWCGRMLSVIQMNFTLNIIFLLPSNILLLYQ